MDELDDLLARTEAEAAAAEAEVERLREAAIAPHRARVRELAQAVAEAKARVEAAAGQAKALARRANQESARHQLEVASVGAPRSPFGAMPWAPARALATAALVGGFLVSLPFCWVSGPAILIAWLVGRRARDDG